MRKTLLFATLLLSLCSTIVAEEAKPEKTNASVCAICDDAFEMRINGKTVLSSDINDPVSAKVSLSPGDRITVKCVDLGGVFGFACVIRFDSGAAKPIVSDVDSWKTYDPKDKNAWDKELSNVAKASPGTNVVWKNRVISKTGVKCSSLWGDPKKRTVYLLYEVK